MNKQPNSLDAVKRILSGGNMPGEKAKGGDQRRYKFPATTDEVRIRVLPQKDDPTFPMKISIYHYDIPGISNGKDNEKYGKGKPKDDGKQRGASVKCLQMYGLECPICKVLKKYEGRLELEDWVARISGVANIIVKEDTTQKIDSRLPYITYFSMGMIKWMEKMFESGDGQQLVNLKSGYDIIIHRKKYNGAFEIRNGLTASPLADSPEKIKEIMAQAYNLTDIIGKPDDNLISRSKEAARFLDSEIENKILAASSGTGDDVDVPSFDPDEQIDGYSDSTTADEGTEGTEVADDTEETQEEEAPKTPPKTAAKASSSAAKPAAATKTAAKPAAQGKAKETAPAKAPAKEAKAKSAVARPNGAPECYADDNVHDSNSDKCLECPHEFHCENAIAAAKAG